MINKAIVIGNLGKDAELIRTQNGQPIVKFSVATNERWRDKNTGERHERTHWHNIVVFSEHLAKEAQEFKKGERVYVEGSMQTRKYRKDGETKDRYSTEIIVKGFNHNCYSIDKAPISGTVTKRAPSESDYGETRTQEPRTIGQFHQGQPNKENEARFGSTSSRVDSYLDDQIPF